MIKYYTKKEIVLRLVWTACYCMFFRYSPRLFYGWRNIILRLFGARIGVDVKIYPSVKINHPWLLEVGDRTVIAWGVRIYNLGMIKIGKNTVISQYTHLCGGTHDINKPGFELLRTGLEIGDNVWIASDAFIGPKVVVKHGAIVAARTVVVKNVESFSIVGGNPAKVIGQRVT